jgi:hypothetical protein
VADQMHVIIVNVTGTLRSRYRELVLKAKLPDAKTPLMPKASAALHN